MAGGAAPANTAAQLVQLGEAQALGVFDNHQAGIGHVHTDLDHGGGHQQLQVAGLEFGHHRGFFRRFHAAVDQPDLELAQGTGEVFIGGFGSLAGQFFGLFNQRTYPVRLTPFGAGTAHALDDLHTPRVGHQHGIDRCAAWRQLIEN